MPASDITLYVNSSFTSPYAMSVFVGLREKGIPFEIERVDLGAKQHLYPSYRSLSITWRVPTLVHREVALSESSAITEYLDEVFAPPSYPALYPRDPVQRARARQIQAWLRSDLMPIREERPTTVIFLEPNGQPLSAEARAAAEKLFTAADALLSANSTSLFDNWSIADTDLALMLNRLVANGDDVPARLVAYVRHQWQRPSVQAWVEQQQQAARLG